jgi:hypothetical protein
MISQCLDSPVTTPGIVMLSNPNLLAPRRVRCLELCVGFLERLKRLRVLDSACGSGNFLLYLVLLALKDLEHGVNLDCEAIGFNSHLSDRTPFAGSRSISMRPNWPA